MSIQEKCRILDHQNIAPQHFKLTLSSAYISSHSEPGQFVNVKIGKSYDPLLRRPLSVHRTSKEHKRFELLYEVVGRGTELLSKYSEIVAPMFDEIHILQKKNEALRQIRDRLLPKLFSGEIDVSQLDL